MTLWLIAFRGIHRFQAFAGVAVSPFAPHGADHFEVAPLRNSLFKSWLASENKHVTSLPSTVNLARVQVEQKGSVTEAITPTSPMPSINS